MSIPKALHRHYCFNQHGTSEQLMKLLLKTFLKMSLILSINILIPGRPGIFGKAGPFKSEFVGKTKQKTNTWKYLHQGNISKKKKKCFDK